MIQRIVALGDLAVDYNADWMDSLLQLSHKWELNQRIHLLNIQLKNSTVKTHRSFRYSRNPLPSNSEWITPYLLVVHYDTIMKL